MEPQLHANRHAHEPAKWRMRPLPVSIVYQTPGIRRLVRAEYAAYSSPNSSTIILSSERTRSAQRITNAIKFDGPATQFGMTSAWPMEYNVSFRQSCVTALGRG